MAATMARAVTPALRRRRPTVLRPGLERRRRQRAVAQRRDASRRSPLVYVALALPVVLVAALLPLAGTGAMAGAVAYAYFARDLPDPRQTLEAIGYDQQTEVYDRSGRTLLAMLGSDRRELVAFEDIPPTLVDATTAAEDKTFWDNPGFDPAGFVSAVMDTLSGRERGGSTITQQLVRDRLLPEGASANGVYERKVKEIIQSLRLTEAYPGVDGKRTILEAYLNNNFYGNRSYGVAAAADGYWGKELAELTLAECALLAAIPKSPTTYDLVRNAVEETWTDDDGTEQVRLIVPPDNRVVRRRNQVLELMKTRAVLTEGMYSEADYEAAKTEPVVLTSQVADRWVAPHFVWQVRRELSGLVCGGEPCEEIATGGYRVVTTLDLRMQRIVEKWLHAAAIIPNAKHPDALLRSRRIPGREWRWIKGLRGHNIHNAAGAVMDYRTGEVRAYAGSASYTARKSRRLQPQFDVMADGWRQPGSSIKPLVYLVGIDDRRMTAATMFMDVVTNFASPGTKPWYPTQADGMERGPVRLRNALQFSLNIPAIKAGFLNGLRHQFKRTKEFGLSYPTGVRAVASQSIGTLETHPVELLGAYGMIANGGVLMPRHTILRVENASGEQIWPEDGRAPKGRRVASRQAAYIITDILAGNSVPSINPFWGRWRVTNGVTGSRVRPAAYKTGTTNDNRDVLAYGYLAPPSDPAEPGLVAGVWMGNSDNSPNDGKLSLDTSAPLWSAVMSEVSKGQPIARFTRVRPKGLVAMEVDAFTGTAPGPTTRKVVSELFIRGTAPTPATVVARTLFVDAASGLVWRDGCAGPKVARAFIDLSRADAGFKAWQKADVLWQRRAAGGPGVAGPRGTVTAYFYGAGFYPYGQGWGGRFAPGKRCPVAPPPSSCTPGDPASPCPSEAPPSASPAP